MGVHRRIAWLSLVLAPAGALATFAACTSSETAASGPEVTDAAVEAEAGPILQPADTGPPPPCVLAQKTGVKACDDCLQASCCVVINTCFADKACASLNTCVNNCGATLGHAEAGAQCVRDCATNEPDGATELVDLGDCESMRCGSVCR